MSYADYFARLINNDTSPKPKSKNMGHILGHTRLLSAVNYQDMQPNDDDDIYQRQLFSEYVEIIGKKQHRL